MTLTEAHHHAVLDAGLAAGLRRVGSTPARSWTTTRDRLVRHREAGRGGSMAFTLRNPARSTEPQRLIRSAATLFVGAQGYEQSVPEGDSDVDAASAAPVPARIARYATADHYARLRVGLDAMADVLRSFGYRAHVVADDNGLVDREAAWRAGIGWYGKNSLILLPGEGSWFVLGSVVTDAVAPVVAEPVADGCGTCRRCLDGCPTGAIVEPGVVDATRCLAWLLQAPGSFPVEHRAALGDRLYGCDECQEVCPPNRTVELRSRRDTPWPTESDPGPYVDAAAFLALDDVELLERCGRWYIPGRDVSVVRRNLLIVLGNSGRRDDPAVRALLAESIESSDPMLAEHARWALDRLDAGSSPALAAHGRTDED